MQRVENDKNTVNLLNIFCCFWYPRWPDFNSGARSDIKKPRFDICPEDKIRFAAGDGSLFICFRWRLFQRKNLPEVQLDTPE